MLLTFGKYKGKSLEEVWDIGDESYLIWLYKQEFVKKDHLDIWTWLDNFKEEIYEDHMLEDPMRYMNWYDFFI